MGLGPTKDLDQGRWQKMCVCVLGGGNRDALSVSGKLHGY